MDEQLTERQMQILQSIVQNYLKTAEPVGSRTISRQSSLGLSSATIRNEMADLEEMGMIVQPHTSAGRIPSSKGYRVYVDSLLHSGRRPSSEEATALRTLMSTQTRQLDNVLKEMGKILSTLTQYPTVVTMPLMKKNKLKQIQLINLDPDSVIVVIVTDGNIVRNHIIKVPRPLSTEETMRMSEVLNRYLKGLSLEEINLPIIQKIRQEMGSEQDLVISLLDAIQNTVQYADEVEMFASGTANLLDFPEFSDITRARALMDVFQHKEDMLAAIGSSKPLEDSDTIRVVIGNENQIQPMKDCSVITTSISVGERNLGSISVIGPVRMDYGKVLSSLGTVIRDFKELNSGEFGSAFGDFQITGNQLKGLPGVTDDEDKK